MREFTDPIAAQYKPIEKSIPVDALVRSVGLDETIFVITLTRHTSERTVAAQWDQGLSQNLHERCESRVAPLGVHQCRRRPLPPPLAFASMAIQPG